MQFSRTFLLTAFVALFFVLCQVSSVVNASNVQARASHILVDSEAKADAILEELLKADDLPAAFAKKAEEVSTCPSGKRSGGDLGTFGRGMMVPEFDEVVFKEPLNVPIKVPTQFGYHIVLITERTGGDDKGGADNSEL